MQACFGWAKPWWYSWYCCSRHLWFYDSGRLGRVEIVSLTVGARAKEGKGGGGGEKKNTAFSLLSPRPPPPHPRSLWLALSPPLLGEFQHGAFASKLRAERKRLHCRLRRPGFVCCQFCTVCSLGLIVVTSLVVVFLGYTLELFCNVCNLLVIVNRVNTRWRCVDRIVVASEAIAWVSGVSGGKGERWKRKRERASPPPPSPIKNLLSPIPLGRPDTQASEAIVICLLLSWRDSLSKVSVWWSWLWNAVWSVKNKICLLLSWRVVKIELLWPVRQLWFACYCHGVILSASCLFDDHDCEMLYGQWRLCMKNEE